MDTVAAANRAHRVEVRPRRAAMSLWEAMWDLPKEVLEPILACLSLRQAIQLQLVCSSWRRRLSPFLSQDGFPWREDVHIACMFSNHHQVHCFGFNVVLRQWQKLPLLPPWHRMGNGIVMSSNIDGKRADSYRGLLCWNDHWGSQVYVCSPGRNTLTPLPAIQFRAGPENIGWTTGFTVTLFAGPDGADNGVAAGYRVLAMLCNPLTVSNAGPSSVFLYRSSNNAWNRLNSNMHGSEVRNGLFLSSDVPVLVDHSVFASAGRKLDLGDASGGYGHDSLKFTHLVEYDLELEAWRNTCAVDWPGWKKLLRCGNTVVVATLDCDTRRVQVHRLDRLHRRMELLVQTPLAKVGFPETIKFFSKAHELAASGNKVYVLRLNAKRLTQMTSFDVVTGIWEELPLSPFPFAKVKARSPTPHFWPLRCGFDLR